MRPALNAGTGAITTYDCIEATELLSVCELLGIPHCVIIGDRGLAAGQLEYRNRRTGETGELPVNGLLDAIRARLA